MTVSESGTQTEPMRGADLEGLAQRVEAFQSAVDNLVGARYALISHMRAQPWPAPMKFHDDETHGEFALAARLEPDEDNGATPFILHMNGVEYDGETLSPEQIIQLLRDRCAQAHQKGVLS